VYRCAQCPTRWPSPFAVPQLLPAAKIAVLYQNDDVGKDYLTGLREGLGDKADKMIVATESYERTDATIDSQILSLRQSGADVMVTLAIPKFALQSIRKIYAIGWKPTHFLTNTSASVAVVMRPVGPEKSTGIHHGGVRQRAD
jgi:branched-chain amino acid transport system substrate-binding protein